MSKVPLTAIGAEMLRTELTDLKSVQRPQVIQAIADAREHGDLKENAEYHAAREQQSFIEGRIKEIEGKLSHAQVIDVTQMNAAGKVIFGETVDLLDMETEESVTYQIVGDDEANIKKGLISFSSPLARAIIGKTEGDDVEFQSPGGMREYEIQAIRYIWIELIGNATVQQRSGGCRYVTGLNRQQGAAALFREDNNRLFFISPVEYGSLANSLHDGSGAFVCQWRAGWLALGAITDGNFYLHQLVMSQRDVEFGLHCFGYSLLPDTDNRLQCVAHGFEMFKLFFIESHQGQVEYQSWDCADRAKGGVNGA